MATAQFGTGVWSQDTFGAPTGASFAALVQTAILKESGFAILATAGALIPQDFATLNVSASILGLTGKWDEGTFDSNLFSDTESSSSILAQSAAFTSASFAALQTGAGEIKPPGTVFEFRDALATSGDITVESASTAAVLFTVARIVSREPRGASRAASALYRQAYRKRYRGGRW